MASKPKIPQFLVERKFTSGLQTKLLNTELPQGAAQSATNFIVGDQGKWVTRGGTKYLGTKSAETGGCRSCFTMVRRDGTEIPMVQYADKVKIYHPQAKDWCVLKSGLSTTAVMGWCMADVRTEMTNAACFCDAVDDYAYWNGATGVQASATSNSLTVAGTVSLADLGFTATGSFTDSGGTVYAYTGLSGQTFTTVTPDPTAVTADSGIMQTPVTSPSTPKGNVLCSSQYGRVILGGVIPASAISGTSTIWISKVNLYTDFTWSATRVSGEGWTVAAPNGGGSIRGIEPFESGFLVAKDRTVFKLDDNDGNAIPFPLAVFANQGSVSPLCFFPSENSVNFVTPDFLVTALQRVQGYDQYPQPLPISDPIKPTTDSLLFNSRTAGKNYDGRDFYSCMASASSLWNDRLLTYNKRYGCWDGLWEGFNAACFFTYQSDLYACLAGQPDVVKLFEGRMDFQSFTQPGVPITASLILRNDDMGQPALKKELYDGEYWIEGEMYLTGSAKISLALDNGTTLSGTIEGNGATLAYSPTGGFGAEDFGVETFGEGSTGSGGADLPVRFRLILTSVVPSFYWMAFAVDTSSYFKLIAHGPKAVISSEEPSPDAYQSLS